MTPQYNQLRLNLLKYLREKELMDSIANLRNRISGVGRTSANNRLTQPISSSYF